MEVAVFKPDRKRDVALTEEDGIFNIGKFPYK